MDRKPKRSPGYIETQLHFCRQQALGKAALVCIFIQPVMRGSLNTRICYALKPSGWFGNEALEGYWTHLNDVVFKRCVAIRDPKCKIIDTVSFETFEYGTSSADGACSARTGFSYYGQKELKLAQVRSDIGGVLPIDKCTGLLSRQ